MNDVKQLQLQIQQLTTQVKTLLDIINPQVSCPYTLYGWYNEWLSIYKKPKLGKKGLEGIENCMRNHIKPILADKPLRDVTGLDVQNVLNHVTAGRTRQATYYVFFQMFRQAEKLRILPYNPMTAVDSVSYKVKKGKSLTAEQQREFLKITTTNKYRLLYRFYLYSGCRRSEALGLRWTDIDYDTRTIHIPGTKTEGSNRYIPLFPILEKLFAQLPHRSAYVFDVTVNALNCNFKRLKAKHNFPYRLHDLRHTFATRCLESGISLKTIQKWLGHSRLETTSNVYTHVTTAFERDEVTKFNPEK